MQRAAVALVVGLLLGISVPGHAHHSRTAQKVRRLTNRVAALESTTNQLLNVAQRHNSDINILDNRTTYLDGNGLYYGPVYEIQVITETCLHGDDAVWIHHPEDPPEINFLGCVAGPYKRSTQQQEAFEGLWP